MRGGRVLPDGERGGQRDVWFGKIARGMPLIDGGTNTLLDLPWFQSKPCEDLTQLTCRWNGSCQIRSQKIHGLPHHLRKIVCRGKIASRFQIGRNPRFPRRKPIEGSKLTSLGAPPCPRSITVCSDLLSELPTIHKDRMLAPLCLGDLGMKAIPNRQPKTPTPQFNNPSSVQGNKYQHTQQTRPPRLRPYHIHIHFPLFPLPLPTLTRPTHKRRRRVMVVMGRSVARARR
jgi:hypothetical protein